MARPMISNQETHNLIPYMAIYDIVVSKDNMLRQINELVDFSYILCQSETNNQTNEWKRVRITKEKRRFLFKLETESVSFSFLRTYSSFSVSSPFATLVFVINQLLANLLLCLSWIVRVMPQNKKRYKTANRANKKTYSKRVNGS